MSFSEMNLPQLDPVKCDLTFVGPMADDSFIMSMSFSTEEIKPGIGKYGKVIHFDDTLTQSSKDKGNGFIESKNEIPEAYRPKNVTRARLYVVNNDVDELGYIQINPDGKICFSDKNDRQFLANGKEIGIRYATVQYF